MESLLAGLVFLLAMALLIAPLAWLGWYALTLHHDREKARIRAREQADQAKYLIMDKALEKGLPPGRINYDV